MKSNYRKLGKFIELVSNLNTDLNYGESDVRGVSNNKEIMQTKADNRGRDLSGFYVVAPDDFIYNSRTSRMGDKVGLGFNDTGKAFITSFNNTVFKVKNEELLPMYLFMWFSRPEFDRYVRYHSWGSSTEIFPWKEMCNVVLPIPHIDKQKEIVAEYNTIVNRIKLNEQLNQKLEETAQAIYKQWFVDFEFPDENGKPYKSSGGEMEYCAELDKEIPNGWKSKPVEKSCNILDFKRKPLSGLERSEMQGEYRYYGAMGIVDYIDGYIFDGIYVLLSEDGVNVVDENGYPALQYVWGQFWVNNHAHILQGNKGLSNEYLYLTLGKTNVADLVTGAAQPKINQTSMAAIPMLIPEEQVLANFDEITNPIFGQKRIVCDQTTALMHLQDLVLNRISKS